MKTLPKPLLAGLLIDPYCQTIRRIACGPELDDWRKVLQCDWVEHHLISREENGTTLDLWFNEEFAIDGVVRPMFTLHTRDSGGGYPLEIAGYGLVFAGNGGGETMALLATEESMNAFAVLAGLGFERHNHLRLAGYEFIEEQLRMIELEMPDRFRFLGENEWTKGIGEELE